MSEESSGVLGRVARVAFCIMALAFAALAIAGVVILLGVLVP